MCIPKPRCERGRAPSRHDLCGHRVVATDRRNENGELTKPARHRLSGKSRDQAAAFIGMHIIIRPPQFIIIGIPICIMLIMFSQHFMNMSFMAGSIGIISQVMPLAVMVHFIWQPIIGMPPIIIGFIMPPAIIGFIMLPDIIGFIMPPIIIGVGIICVLLFHCQSSIHSAENDLSCLLLGD